MGGRILRGYAQIAVLLFAVIGTAYSQTFPPLATEISADRPLFVFQAPRAENEDPLSYVQRLGEAWAALPESLKPFSAYRIDTDAPDAPARHARFQGVLSGLQSLDIPTIIVIGKADPNTLQPLELVEELLSDYTCVKGVWVSDLSFNDYFAFGGGDGFGTPPQVRWLTGAIDTAARYGRFLVLRLGAHAWPHALANAWNKPLFDKLRACANYVIPMTGVDGDDTIPQQGMVTGLWLQGLSANWGLEASPRWFDAARFIEPGVYGVAPKGTPMPPAFYRAMVLNGAMGGATVYAFDDPRDLWGGERAAAWDSAIQPALQDVINLLLIPRREFVQKKARVAYQMSVCRTPADLRTNLRDIDGVLGEGLMLAGAYGMERPGQVPELIPNTGSHYWVPILSPFTEPKGFARVIAPGAMNSAGEWTQLLDQYLVPDGTGPAFVSVVGRSVFVLHTRENQYEEQKFRIPNLPAPVRGFKAARQDTTVTVSWTPRENDSWFRVYRRAYPDGAYQLVADKLDQKRSWVDENVDPQAPLAYAVTALTNEQTPYEGTVNYGDYLAFSMVYSRIAEEAVVTPLVMNADSQPIAPNDTRPKSQEWWPNLQGVADENKPLAQEIAARIEQWDAAFSKKDLRGVVDIYAPSYQDPQNWGSEYVARAYQWFFERYNRCTMARQIRQWDFSNVATNGQVRVLLYCRFSGAAVSDPSGRIAAPHAQFPLSETGEVWLNFIKTDTGWRIEHSEPALPNMRELLSYSAGPFDAFIPGPDATPQPAAPAATPSDAKPAPQTTPLPPPTSP